MVDRPGTSAAADRGQRYLATNQDPAARRPVVVGRHRSAGSDTERPRLARRPGRPGRLLRRAAGDAAGEHARAAPPEPVGERRGGVRDRRDVGPLRRRDARPGGAIPALRARRGLRRRRHRDQARRVGGGRGRLVDHRIWTPLRGEALDLEATVERWLLDLADRFPVEHVLFDPFQAHRSATTLARAGRPMVELPQTPDRLVAGGQGLYELSGRARWPPTRRATRASTCSPRSRLTPAAAATGSRRSGRGGASTAASRSRSSASPPATRAAGPTSRRSTNTAPRPFSSRPTRLAGCVNPCLQSSAAQ